MATKRFSLATGIWLALFSLLAVAITVTTYLTLIIPEYRHRTFYQAMVASCLAELVFFVYLSYVLLRQTGERDTSQAVRHRSAILMVFWLITVLATSAIAVYPSLADTFYSDKLLIWQLVLTFFFFIGIYFLTRQQAVLDESRALSQQQTTQTQAYALGIDTLVSQVNELMSRKPQQLVKLEGLQKRLDLLRTQLISSPPVTPREDKRLVSPLGNEQIEQKLRTVHDNVRALLETSPGNFEQQLQITMQAIDGIVTMLRRQEDTLTL